MNSDWQVCAPWDRLLPALSELGLNAVGVTEPDAEAAASGARSAVVFASGGPALWQAFVAAIESDPTVLTAHAHPLDQFIARRLAALDAGSEHRFWVRCAWDAERFVDFRPLARSAGLGWPSRLGLLLHPTHGPWMGLRAVCFTTDALPKTGALAAPGPCEGCAAPCASACPTSAVSLDAPFDIRACASHKQGGGCAGSCAARNACPMGSGSRYPMLEQNYHDDRVSGRVRLAADLGITQDGHVGEGPYWADWVGAPSATES